MNRLLAISASVAVAFAAAVFGSAQYAKSSGVFTGFPTPSTATPAYPFPTGTESFPADTGLAQGLVPETALLPGSAVAGLTWGTPRNFLGNGGLNVTSSNGTSTVTCAQNAAPTVAALSADRWACQANVAVGAGRTAIVTSGPTPPTGFTNVMKVFRTSGALTQPVCVWSAVPTPDATQLAGQQVTFSAQVAALAGLAADNGNVANMVIISGTGTDEGLNASPTASPAITPAWTGITTVVNTPITLTTTFGRFSTTAIIPTTATEVGVGFCFTPTATGSGATDGFAWVGAQLERGSIASLFEVHPKSYDVTDAQKYFYVTKEGALGPVRAPCVASSTSLLVCTFQFPATMYKTPTMSYTNGFAGCSTVACTAAAACTVIRTSTAQAFAADANRVALDCTSAAGFAAAGSAAMLFDNGGAGVINAWTGL